MNKHKRWEKAQEYEQRYWEDVEYKFLQDNRKVLYHMHLAEHTQRRIASIEEINNPIHRMLEIGSGPLGIIGFMDAEEKYAIDPLEDFFKTRPGFLKLRDKSIQYMKGVAEDLPFSDSYFDFIIIQNVLDHTQAPNSVLSEIWRTLKDGGHMYLEVDVFTSFAAKIHSFLELFQVDKGHPHTFDRINIHKCLQQNKFQILNEECESYKTSMMRFIRSPYLRRKLYALSGFTKMRYDAVCKKVVKPLVLV